MTRFGLALLCGLSLWAPLRAEEAAEAAEAGEAGEPTEEQVNAADSAVELSQKLEQLKALLDAKGDDADPDLKARLAGLSSQLASLGLGDMADSLSGGGGMQKSKELTEFLTVCVGLSHKHMMSTGKRSDAHTALKLLVKGKKLDQRTSMDMWKLTATCINELTEEELKQFKNHKLAKLPKVYVEAAKKPEAEKSVQELDEGIWEELKIIATAMVGDEEDPTPPIIPGILAGVLFLGVVGFLAKKFMDMQKGKDEKKNKKREGKKSK